MIYGGTGNPALTLPRGGAPMSAPGPADLSSIPLPQLGQLSKQDQNPALKAAAMEEIAKRAATPSLEAQTAMPEPGQTPLGAVATGEVSTPGQLPPVVPASQTNPAMNAIATGATAADAASGMTPSALDQGVPPSTDSSYASAASPPINPAIAAASPAFPAPGPNTIGDLASPVPLSSPQDKWLAAAKGFGAMAASRQPGLLGAIGEGAGSAADALIATRSRDIAADQNQQALDLNKQDAEQKIAVRQQQMQSLLAAVAQLPPELRTQAMADPDAFFGAQFKAMFDKQQIPAAIQEYQAAVADGGFKGSFADYQIMLKQAGRSQTNINMPKSINAGDSKMLELGAQDYLQSQQVLPMFDIAASAAKNTPNTGLGGQLALWYQRGKSALGLPNNANDYEVLQGMQTKLGSLSRLPGSGATSDMEMSLYMQSAPSLFNSQTGNLALASIGKKLAQRRISNYQKLQSYIQTNGSSVGYQPDDSPVLDDGEMKALQSAASGSGGSGGSADPGASPAEGARWDPATRAWWLQDSKSPSGWSKVVK